MVYYLSRINEGLISCSAKGDGYTISLRWSAAYPSTVGNKIAYHIYMSTDESQVFAEGIKFVSIDGYTQVDIIDLSPGQLYHFAVRAVEYDQNVINASQLPEAFNNLKVYPNSFLRNNITDTDILIPLIDVSDFPNYGIIQIGVELINYLSKDSFNNNLVLTNASLQRGFLNTLVTKHNTDGYDGYETWIPPYASYILGKEEGNTKRFPCQNRFDFDSYQRTNADGYHQVIKDLLTSDLSGSDEYNENFSPYDYAGWHRTDPVQLLNGECVGSYIGGEQYCADGYDTVGGVIRGMTLQEHNNQRQELLLSVTGEPIVLLKRMRTGITCNCFTPGQEYPDDRCPKCFVPGTLVKAKSGWKKIEEILEGEQVLSSDGKYHNVIRIHKNKYDGILKSISTTTSTKPIVTTLEHPFLTLRGSHKVKGGCGPNSNCKLFIDRGNGDSQPLDVRLLTSGRWHARITDKNTHKRVVLGTFDTREEAINAVEKYKNNNFVPGHFLKWDEAQNIKVNDWLVSKSCDETTDIKTIIIPNEFLKNTKLGSKRNGSIEFSLDEEFLWIAGIYIAEGSAGKRSLNFALHKNEIEYQNKIINFFKKYGFNSKVYKRSTNGINIEIFSTTLSLWFPYLFGKLCYNKKIPEQFTTLPKNKIKALIQGIFDGDGGKRDNDITQTSEILAMQIIDLLHKCDEMPTVRQVQHSKLTPKGNKRKLAYCISLQKDHNLNKNRKGRWKFNNELLTKVKSVTDVLYSGYVYNLEVEDSHTYIVQNIVVHNCHGSKFVVGYEQYFNPRRSDGRIMMRFSPADEDVKMQEAGLESDMQADVWTLTVPTIKDRDILIRFDQDGNEEFRYEVLSVNRNKTISSLQGGQKLRVQRIRKFDPSYQIRAFKDTSMFPSVINTSSGSTTGIPAHSHAITINEKTTSLTQINQTTGIAFGHTHSVIDGIVQTALGHTHIITI